jgi:competence protein ComEA
MMKKTFAGRRAPKGLRQPRLLFILIATVGIAAVTLMNGAGADDTDDVLRPDTGTVAIDDVAGDTVSGRDDPVTAAGATSPANPDSPDDAGTHSVQESPTEESTIYVDIYGAVAAPSVYKLNSGSRVYDAIEMAGGLSDDADIRFINRAAALNDGDRIYIPTKKEIESGDTLPESAGIAGASSGAPQGENDAVAAVREQGASSNGDVININTADSATLQRLNGVGPATAQKIIDYRDSNGPFAQAEDIKDVSGIGDKTYEKLKDYICV